jgi:hypothetical protein
METINQTTYESGLEEFLQFGEGLLEEALRPYAHQIHGHWKSSTIRENMEAGYHRFLEIKNPGVRIPRIEGTASYRGDSTAEEIGERIASSVGACVEHYFSENGKGLIYVIDFRIFKKDFSEKLFEINQKQQNMVRIKTL